MGSLFSSWRNDPDYPNCRNDPNCNEFTIMMKYHSDKYIVLNNQIPNWFISKIDEFGAGDYDSIVTYKRITNYDSIVDKINFPGDILRNIRAFLPPDEIPNPMYKTIRLVK